MRPSGIILDNDNSGRPGLGDTTIPLVRDTCRHESLKRRLCKSVRPERGSRQRTGAKDRFRRAMINAAKAKRPKIRCFRREAAPREASTNTAVRL